MKVLVIDPWCNDYDGLAGYTIGLCEGLADNVELTLCSGYYESHKTDRYNIHPIFFRFSDKMKNSVFRKIVRGIEYICSYVKIYRVT